MAEAPTKAQPTIDLSGLSEEEATTFRELVRQVAQERGGEVRPRLSVLAALAAMPAEAVAVMIQAFNRGACPHDDTGLSDTTGSDPARSSGTGCTPSVSGSEEEDPRPVTPDLAAVPSHGREAPAGRGQGPTTVMLKCLGTVYTMQTLLDAAGFAGCYDYLYVPVLYTGGAEVYNNRFGFAVVNFVDHETANAFRMAVVGQSVKKLQASWARVQGAQGNLDQVQERRRTGKLPGQLYEGMVPWVFCGVDRNTGRSLGRPLQVEAPGLVQ